MRSLLGKYLTSSIALIAMLMPVLPAHALSVQPAIQDIVLDPGGTITKSLRVTNDEDSIQTFFVTIQKFVPKGENGQQDFLPASDTSGLPEWMYVDKPELTLKPGQSMNLQVSVRVPPGATPGGYYAALFLSKRQAANEPLAMLPKLGVLFFVRLNGDVQERLALTQFSVDRDSYSSLPVGFRAVVANEGMVHEVPQGTITVKNFFGMTVAKFPANPDGNRVLPGSSRVFLSSWAKGDSIFSNFAIGPHVAFVTFNGPGFSGDVVREVRFSVWPWQTLLGIAGLLVLAIIGYFLLKRIIIKRATSRPKI